MWGIVGGSDVVNSVETVDTTSRKVEQQQQSATVPHFTWLVAFLESSVYIKSLVRVRNVEFYFRFR